MKVDAWLRRHPGCVARVGKDAPLEEVMDLYLSDERLRAVFVVDEEERPVGWISGNRILSLAMGEYRPRLPPRLLLEHVDPGRAKVLMNQRLATAHCDEELEDVVHRMLEADQEDLPVVADRGANAGVIHVRELVRSVRQGRRDAEEGASDPPKG